MPRALWNGSVRKPGSRQPREPGDGCRRRPPRCSTRFDSARYPPNPGRFGRVCCYAMAGPAASPHDKAFFGHPRGLATLFFTEMWERFSYYGMRALLLLYMTAPLSAGGMELDTATGGAIYGLYTSMVYMATMPGGWVADRLIGQRSAVLYGGILIACGHFSMAVPLLAMFYLGLFLIVIGTGLLKGNVS